MHEDHPSQQLSINLVSKGAITLKKIGTTVGLALLTALHKHLFSDVMQLNIKQV